MNCDINKMKGQKSEASDWEPTFNNFQYTSQHRKQKIRRIQSPSLMDHWETGSSEHNQDTNQNANSQVKSFRENKQFLMYSENSKQDNEIQAFLAQLGELHLEQLEQFQPEVLREVTFRLIGLLQKKVEQTQNSKIIHQQLIACRQKIQELNLQLAAQQQNSELIRRQYEDIKILMTEHQEQYLKYKEENSFSKDRICELEKMTEEQEMMSSSRIHNLSLDLLSKEEESRKFRQMFQEKVKYVSQIQSKLQSAKRENQQLEKQIEEKTKEFKDFQLFTEKLFDENERLKERIDNYEISKIQKVERSFTDQIQSSAPISQCENQHSQQQRDQDSTCLKNIEESNYHISSVESNKKTEQEIPEPKIKKKHSAVAPESYRRNTISFSKKANQSQKKIPVSNKRIEDKSIKTIRGKQGTESRKKVSEFVINRRSGGNSPFAGYKIHQPEKLHRVHKEIISPIEQKYAEDYTQFATKKYTEDSDEKKIQILNKQIVDLNKKLGEKDEKLRYLDRALLQKRERITQLEGEMEIVLDQYDSEIEEFKHNYKAEMKSKSYLETIDLRTELYEKEEEIAELEEKLEKAEAKIKYFQNKTPKIQSQISEKIQNWIQKIAAEDEVQINQLQNESPVKKVKGKRKNQLHLCSQVYIQSVFNEGTLQQFQIKDKDSSQSDQEINLPQSIQPTKKHETDMSLSFLGLGAESANKCKPEEKIGCRTEDQYVQTDLGNQHKKMLSFGSVFDQIFEHNVDNIDDFEAISFDGENDDNEINESISIIRKNNKKEQFDLGDLEKMGERDQKIQEISFIQKQSENYEHYLADLKTDRDNKRPALTLYRCQSIKVQQKNLEPEKLSEEKVRNLSIVKIQPISLVNKQKMKQMEIIKLGDTIVIGNSKQLKKMRCQSFSIKNTKQLNKVELQTISVSFGKQKMLGLRKIDEMSLIHSKNLSLVKTDQYSLTNDKQAKSRLEKSQLETISISSPSRILSIQKNNEISVEAHKLSRKKLQKIQSETIQISSMVSRNLSIIKTEDLSINEKPIRNLVKSEITEMHVSFQNQKKLSLKKTEEITVTDTRKIRNLQKCQLQAISIFANQKKLSKGKTDEFNVACFRILSMEKLQEITVTGVKKDTAKKLDITTVQAISISFNNIKTLKIVKCEELSMIPNVKILSLVKMEDITVGVKSQERKLSRYQMEAISISFANEAQETIKQQITRKLSITPLLSVSINKKPCLCLTEPITIINQKKLSVDKIDGVSIVRSIEDKSNDSSTLGLSDISWMSIKKQKELTLSECSSFCVPKQKIDKELNSQKTPEAFIGRQLEKQEGTLLNIHKELKNQLASQMKIGKKMENSEVDSVNICKKLSQTRLEDPDFIQIHKKFQTVSVANSGIQKSLIACQSGRLTFSKQMKQCKTEQISLQKTIGTSQLQPITFTKQLTVSEFQYTSVRVEEESDISIKTQGEEDEFFYSFDNTRVDASKEQGMIPQILEYPQHLVRKEIGVQSEAVEMADTEIQCQLIYVQQQSYISQNNQQDFYFEPVEINMRNGRNEADEVSEEYTQGRTSRTIFNSEGSPSNKNGHTRHTSKDTSAKVSPQSSKDNKNLKDIKILNYPKLNEIYEEREGETEVFISQSRLENNIFESPVEKKNKESNKQEESSLIQVKSASEKKQNPFSSPKKQTSLQNSKNISIQDFQVAQKKHEIKTHPDTHLESYFSQKKFKRVSESQMLATQFMKKYWWDCSKYYVLECQNVTDKKKILKETLIFWKCGLVSLTSGKSMKCSGGFPRRIPEPGMLVLGNCEICAQKYKISVLRAGEGRNRKKTEFRGDLQGCSWKIKNITSYSQI